MKGATFGSYPKGCLFGGSATDRTVANTDGQVRTVYELLSAE